MAHRSTCYTALTGTAFFWNVEALMAFLTRNGLSHVVRAHEVQQNGFQASVTRDAGCVTATAATVLL